MQLEAVRQLQCRINSAGSLQVMGEIAPRKEQGRQAGRCISFYGKVMAFSWERVGSLFRCSRKRGTNGQWGSALKT